MKNLIAFVLVCFILMFSSLAFAHSGRTDKYGCHTDHKTGIRH